MNKYVIEHKEVIPGSRDHRLIQVVGEVYAPRAIIAWKTIASRYRLDTDTEFIHVRRAS